MSSTSWQCETCTFLHEGILAELTSCTICEAQRPLAPPIAISDLPLDGHGHNLFMDPLAGAPDLDQQEWTPSVPVLPEMVAAAVPPQPLITLEPQSMAPSVPPATTGDPTALQKLLADRERQLTELQALVRLLQAGNQQLPEISVQEQSSTPAASCSCNDEELPTWLASAAAHVEFLQELDTAALPPGWRCGWASEYARTYYYNVQLARTQWEHPSTPLLATNCSQANASSARYSSQMSAGGDSPASISADMGGGTARTIAPHITATPARPSELNDPVEFAAWSSQQQLEAWARVEAQLRAQREVLEAERIRVIGEEHGALLSRARQAWAALDQEARAELQATSRAGR